MTDKRKHTAEFFERARYEEVFEKECFDVVRRMNINHGIDVVLPVLETLEARMDKEAAQGEHERLV